MASQISKSYKIVWTNTFQNELQHLYNYLLFELNASPSTTKKLHKNIMKALYSLQFFPERFATLSSCTTSPPLRKLPILS